MNSLNSMEQFLILFSTIRSSVASDVCQILEESDIPVMLEHVDVVEDGSRKAGYRVLVPMQWQQTAQGLLSKINARANAEAAAFN